MTEQLIPSTAPATIQANRLDRRIMDGKQFAVAPVVALVASVVNGSLVTPAELAIFVQA